MVQHVLPVLRLVGDEALGLLPIDLSGPQPQEGQIMMTSMGTEWLHRA